MDNTVPCIEHRQNYCVDPTRFFQLFAETLDVFVRILSISSRIHEQWPVVSYWGKTHLACCSGGGPIWFHRVASFSIRSCSAVDVPSQSFDSSVWYIPKAFWLSFLSEDDPAQPPVLFRMMVLSSSSASTPNTLLPVQLLMYLNFSADALFLPYVWNHEYRPWYSYLVRTI